MTQTPVHTPGGVHNIEEAGTWLRERGIEDIECIAPDIAGVARGKMMPTQKFLSSSVMTMPSSIFAQTISGDYPDDDDHFQHEPTDGDLFFHPDFSTLRSVPWESDPTAQIIHDASTRDGTPVGAAPRNVLRNIIDLYAARNWQPIVSPEIEFFLVKPNTDPDYPLEPPVGRSGRPEVARQSYSISALNEFDEVIDDIYQLSEDQGLEIDTLTHEEGAAQMEINLRHGEPLMLADQVFLFKRTIREAALRHNMYATFMAKPMAAQPGSSMHIHQSVLDRESGQNIFTDRAGNPTDNFMGFIAGHQRYLPAMTCIMAPYVNSYRRFVRDGSAPVNFFWGEDNRTVGLRVPNSSPAGRRLENRLPSSDTNPYLAIAASLACGYLGMIKGLTPDEPITGTANQDAVDIPRSILEALHLFVECDELMDVFPAEFIHTYRAVKEHEFETFMSVISSWEREYLLLNV